MLINEPFVAGVMKPFFVPGNFIRLKKADGLTLESVNIDIFHDGTKLRVDLTKIDAGDKAEVPEGFDRIEVTSTVNQNLQIQVAQGKVDSNRVTGEVSFVDGGKSRTLSNFSFMGNANIAAVAANFSHGQLWNPSATRRLVVEGFALDLTPVTSFTLGGYNVALTTLVGNPASKNIGGAVSVAEVRSQAAGALLVTLVNRLQILDLPNASPYQFRFLEPVVVPPNQGLVIAANTVNTALNISWEFFEEVI